ncbi:hypothetical protein C0Q70_08016 [Pomacea canaliculata]|uniref:Exoribonuclease phosphorolytic domain-containing protein n=1 Tax=Pomacea canaliculata TaxID=400727 RepID=A0A2T7PGM0_POMCA|nr:hypothetical protein C0Q70_08016 [Pomacea canaliculata]
MKSVLRGVRVWVVVAARNKRYGPREVARREDVQMQGQVTCEFKFAPFSCHVRRQPVQDSQEKDLSTQLLEAIRPAICLDKFPKLQVDVYVTVLENDGSALAAAITCASIAVASAGIDMYDLVIGSSAKILGERIFVDPTNSEENTCMDDDPARVGGQLTIGLLPSLNQVSELTFQGDIGFNVLSQAVQICQDTCHKLYPVVQQTLEKIVKDKHKNI